MTQEAIQRINDLAEELHDKYEYIGIRVQDVPFELGEMDHASHVWNDGEDTGEELDGVSALSLANPTWNSLINQYYGSHVAIICGFVAQYGEDEGEIIIEDPVVVEIIA